jgi:ubiquinone/menaquinone biosynthesis C-methylase UbiE
MPSDGDQPVGLSDHTASNRATYDRIAVRYAQHQNQPQIQSDDLFSTFEQSFLKKVPSAGLIADMGCGPALDGGRFAAQGYRVMGLDLSAGMLAVASQRLPGQLVQADLRALPIVSDQLDAIWSVASLLHVPERDTSTVLLEFRRTLSDAGTLALITALGEGEKFEEVAYAPGEHRWFVFRSEELLGEQVTDAGFRIETQGQVLGNRWWSTILASSV